MAKSPKQSTLKLELQIKKANHHFKNNEFQLALNIGLEILQFAPDDFEANFLAGVSSLRLGQLAQAMQLLGCALQCKRLSTKCQQSYLEGLLALFTQQDYTLLTSSAIFFTEHVPESGQGWQMLGVGLAQIQQYEHAKAALLRAKSLLPANPYVLCSLGNAYNDLGDIEQALQEYRQAIILKPDFAMVFNNMGNALGKTVHKEEALKNYQHALRIKPDYVEAISNMGVLLKQMAKYDEAIVVYKQALALAPDSAAAMNNLAGTLRLVSRVNEALAFSEKALLKEPERPQFWLTYALSLADAFRLDDAIECHLKALSFTHAHISETVDGVFGALLFHLNYHPDHSAEVIYGAYDDYEQRFGAPFRAQWKDFTNIRETDRRLKIGYVSSAFASHPCKNFLLPLLEHHQHKNYEIFAFAELGKTDDYTEKYKQRVDHWLVTTGMTDDGLAERIRAEQIDILVDISGHTGGHRLAVFARKPAPVSLHWLDYGYTTGLKAIDYYLTDQYTIPDGQEHLFSETPWRLPRPAYAFRPNPGMGEVGASPALKNEYVTFGTLTRSIRINHRTVRVWSEILKQVPNSLLIINSGNFRTREVQEMMLMQFAEQGISADRIDVGYESPPWDSLRKIDIGFDCFPHNSGTTLFETLLMGVPFITLAGRASVGRLGASILHGVGHPEWIAYSEEEYISKAIALAGDHEQLAHIRSHLRAEMQASEIMDEPGFTVAVEQAYRQMWHQYCEGK
jgi:protein O-GlcNAc transferase